MQTIIFDASVVIKTLVDEKGSESALECMNACLYHHSTMKAPNLLQYEVANVANREGVSIEKYADFMESTIDTLIKQESPSRVVWIKAEEITQEGNKKSGFPAMYDSIYHAMAIVDNGVFVTADRRHYEKARSFKHIVMLDDWKTIFSDQEE